MKVVGILKVSRKMTATNSRIHDVTKIGLIRIER